MNRTLSFKPVLVILVVGTVLAAIFYTSRGKREEYRNKIIALTAELSKRQHTNEEVRRLLRETRFRGLTLTEDPSNVWAVETPVEYGATNWILYIE
jgi:hypothetical protein